MAPPDSSIAISCRCVPQQQQPEGHHVAWWHGIVHNNQLRMAQADMHYLMPNCAAIAYHYPDQKAKEQEGQGEPPGATDVSQWMRPEMKAQIPGLLQYMAEQQAAMLAERQPFFYIAFLAVQPEGQGQGLGGRMLRHLLRRADEAGRWSYLEATNDRNVQLYQRHGFSIRSQSSWAVLDACPGLEGADSGSRPCLRQKLIP
ncbi:N-acetyltransferase domain-containing protein, partial [Haematococcus lacustris]